MGANFQKIIFGFRGPSAHSLKNKRTVHWLKNQKNRLLIKNQENRPLIKNQEGEHSFNKDIDLVGSTESLRVIYFSTKTGTTPFRLGGFLPAWLRALSWTATSRLECPTHSRELPSCECAL
jgi:hypothetical protein